MNILVTGSQGQLGSEFQQISHLFPHWNFIFYDLPELDITDKNSVDNIIKYKNINVIINCAAYTAVDKAETETENAFKVNAYGVKLLAEAAKEANSLLVHISTDYVFDGKTHFPWKESDTARPVNVYGKSKLEGEEIIREIDPSHLIIRTSWLYSNYGNNFYKTMQLNGRVRDTLYVVSDQAGTPTYARDLVYVILEILNHIRMDEHYAETYHFSNEGICSWYDFACAIMDLSQLHCRVIPCETCAYPTPAERPAYSVFNKTKIKKHWGIQIRHWHKSLEECVNEKIKKE